MGEEGRKEVRKDSVTEEHKHQSLSLPWTFKVPHSSHTHGSTQCGEGKTSHWGGWHYDPGWMENRTGQTVALLLSSPGKHGPPSNLFSAPTPRIAHTTDPNTFALLGAWWKTRILTKNNTPYILTCHMNTYNHKPLLSWEVDAWTRLWVRKTLSCRGHWCAKLLFNRLFNRWCRCTVK